MPTKIKYLGGVRKGTEETVEDSLAAKWKMRGLVEITGGYLHGLAPAEEEKSDEDFEKELEADDGMEDPPVDKEVKAPAVKKTVKGRIGRKGITKG